MFCPMIWSKVKNLQKGGYGYTERKKQVFIPHQTVVIAPNEDADGLSCAFVLSERAPLYGKMEIVFDGVTHTCEYNTVNFDGESFSWYGNSAFIGVGDDTGEPFCVIPTEDGITMLFGADGEHAFSATDIVEEAETIEKKYIPPIDGVLQIVDIHETLCANGMSEIISTKAQYELDRAAETKMPIIVSGELYSSDVNNTTEVRMVMNYTGDGSAHCFSSHLGHYGDNEAVVIFITKSDSDDGWNIRYRKEATT